MFHATGVKGYVVIAALAAAGCANAVQGAALDTTADVMWRARHSVEQESDYRLARQTIPAGLKTAEGFFVANPDNRALQQLLAAGFCGLASFLQDDREVALAASDFDQAHALADRAVGLFLRCVNYSVMYLGPPWDAALYEAEDRVVALLPDTDRDDVPGLLWAAVGLGGAINMRMGDMRLVAHVSKIEPMLKRVIELDPGYQDGMAYVVLGALYCARGAALGGDPATGASLFSRAYELSGQRLLMARVLSARFCAVTEQDRERFRSTLVEVLRTSPAIWPEQRLSNELAHIKARRYLAQLDQLF